MDDYISREAVLTQLCNLHCATDPAVCLFKITHIGEPGCYTVHDILKIPAADVRPVPKGQWVELPRNTPNPITGRCGVYVGCSNCHAPIPTDSFLDYLNELDNKFCYSCGADMRTIGQRLRDISAEEDLFPELTEEEKAENKAEAKRMIGGADG